MITKEDTLTKKITVITGFLVAITGLVAAWTAFVKVHNPPPPKEKKATKAYALLKEKLEFQEMVISDTRDDVRELRMLIMMSRSYGQPAYGPSGDGYDYGMEGSAEEEMEELPEPDELEVPDLDEPTKPSAPAKKGPDPLMSQAKKLPAKL